MMDTMIWVLMILVLVVVVVAIAYDMRTKPNPAPTPIISKEPPRIVDGVALGYKTYADVDNEVCVHVLAVSEGLVKFTFSLPSESSQLPVQRFLETYYRTPNGCAFDD